MKLNFWRVYRATLLHSQEETELLRPIKLLQKPCEYLHLWVLSPVNVSIANQVEANLPRIETATIHA